MTQRKLTIYVDGDSRHLERPYVVQQQSTSEIDRNAPYWPAGLMADRGRLIMSEAKLPNKEHCATDGRSQGAKLILVKDYADGISFLEAKTADAFATDDIVLFGLLAKSTKREDLEVVGRLLTYDPYGIMLRRNDADFRLLVNKALARVFRSGEITRIYAKWFDPIAVPMSPLLRAGFELQALPE